MKSNQISQLLGVKITSQNRKEAIEFTNTILFKIIKLFKSKSFGVITLYGLNKKNLNKHQGELKAIESFIKSNELNYIKIIALWNIKFRDMMSFNEIGYFILNPTFNQMIELTKRFDQSMFVYSENGNTQVYYPNGSKIQLEQDTYEFGTFADNAVILNYVDFKLFIDSVLDFDFHFLTRDEIKIDDRVLIFSKSKFTLDTCLEIVDIYDIRQNGVISFQRSKYSPAISPKVFHFDEIIWIIKLNHKNVITNAVMYRNVV